MRDPFKNPSRRQMRPGMRSGRCSLPRDIDAFLVRRLVAGRSERFRQRRLYRDRWRTAKSAPTNGASPSRRLRPTATNGCGKRGISPGNPLQKTRAPPSSPRRRWKTSRSKAKWHWCARSSTAASRRPTVASICCNGRRFIIAACTKAAGRFPALPVTCRTQAPWNHEGNGVAHFHRGARNRDQYVFSDLRRPARLRSFALCAAWRRIRRRRRLCSAPITVGRRVTRGKRLGVDRGHRGLGRSGRPRSTAGPMRSCATKSSTQLRAAMPGRRRCARLARRDGCRWL